MENLKNIRDGKDRTRPGIKIDAIYEYDVQNTREELEMFCASADFVFNLAGVNRPKDQTEFMEGNFGFASELLDALRSHGNTAPVMLASSIQATLSGRFGDSEYGPVQEGRGGAVLPVCGGNGSEGTGLPVPESLWKMVPPQLQQRCGHLLPQYGQRPANPCQRSVHRAGAALY